MLGGIAFPNSAYAQTSGQSSASHVGPVTKVIFPTGYFQKNSSGGWDEYYANGTLRFPFREVRSSRDSVFLRNDSLQVDIELNMATGEIWAEWPGQFRHVMHRMSDVRNEAPEPIAPPTQTAPPAPPVITPPSTNMRINVVGYRAGELRPSGTQWADYRNDSDAVHLYDVLSESDAAIYLYSDTSLRFYRVDIPAQQLFMAADGGPLVLHSPITEMSAVSANPPSVNVPQLPKPQIPGRLSQSEIEECVWSLGRIERAGILGAERCTRPYSDGGKSCTDSSQCEGQCRAPDLNQTDKAIVGVCQMDDNPFGCHAEVSGGIAQPGLCVD